MVVEENSLNKVLYKIELYLIKIIPFILAIICFLNTILSYHNVDVPLLSYIGGISLIPLLFIYISSFVFKFCIYHRLPLYYVTTNWVLNIIDCYKTIPLTDRELIILYLIITCVFIFITTYFYINDR